jgi:general secretion pathway protein A
MYEHFFNLREKPFQMHPDPDFIYWSKSHSLGYTMLEYGILNNTGFTVITGEIGCGKTTLLRFLLTQLDGSVTVGLLSNTQIRESELLRWIMMALSQRYDQATEIETFHDFQDFLINEYAHHRRVLIIVDEAQNLSTRALEELRMLSNINADKEQLVQIVLIGQPQLRDLLQSPELVQFAQRVTSDFHLGPLSQQEAVDYIFRRIEQAGGQRSLFSHPAAKLVSEVTNGNPRLINMLCDTALVYAFSQQKPYVSFRMMNQVIEDKSRYGLFFNKQRQPQVATL